MRLAEVKGVSRAKAEAAGESWREQRDMREVMVFLQGYGVGAGYAMRIFKKYGSAALEVMKANPYQIALDVQGIGFATADAIAQKLGVPHDSPYRVAAGVHNALNDLTGEGHVYVPRKMLAALAAEKLGVAEEIAAAGIEQARLAGNIVVEEIPGGGEDESAVYLPAFHYAETHSAENLRRIAAQWAFHTSAAAALTAPPSSSSSSSSAPCLRCTRSCRGRSMASMPWLRRMSGR